MDTPNNNLSQTAQVEHEALALVQRDIHCAEKTVLPNTAKKFQKSKSAAQRELYGDKSVPRIRRERRYGGSSHSRAYLKQALCLYSDRAQVFFENNYEHVNSDLIVSTLVIEAIGGTAFADEISAQIEREFSALESKMMSAYSELQRVATAKNIAPDQQVPAYDHKRFYEPPLHTPHSAQFMTVVQLFDRIIARAEGCWIHKVMNAQTRNNVIRSWEKKLANFVRNLHNIRVQAINQARKIGFGQRAAAIEEDVRKQQAEEHLKKTDLPTVGKNDIPDVSAAQPDPITQSSQTETSTSLADEANSENQKQ